MINFHPSSAGELKPRITVIGVGGAGGNAVNNMIQSHLEGVEFIVANTDAQAMAQSRTDRRIQLGQTVTQGLGAGARPEIGRAAAEETLDELLTQLQGSNMLFITAGMGGGTGTGAAPVIARAAREAGILTVGVVTRPFHFEGKHRMRLAEQGIDELSQFVDTLIIIPNQNLFRIASERTTFADAFKMADDVLYSGVRGVTDLMIMPGLINLDFADIRSVMSEMGKAMMGTGEAEGDKRALEAAEAAISNPLLEDISMKGARGVLINITGGMDMTLFEVDEAANRIRDEVDPDANIIFGSTFDEKLTGKMRVSVVATGIEAAMQVQPRPTLISLDDHKRPAAPQPTPRAAAPAERAAPSFAAAPVFHGSAAVSQQPEPMFETTPNERIEPIVANHVEATAEADLEPRHEPTLSIRPVELNTPNLDVAVGRNEPTQRSFSIDPPMSRPTAPKADAPQPEKSREDSRYDVRPEPRMDTRQEEAQPAAAPESGWRNILFPRLGVGKAAPAAAPQPEPSALRPAAPQQTSRITPAERPAERQNDRLSARSSDEDLLDIPAFLRRQAN